MAQAMDLVKAVFDHLHSVEKPVGRPRVLLSYAQSLDGSIAARRGMPLLLSGRDSARLTHSLRAVNDAILVGIGTILADDPQLTIRHVPGKNPIPVILDSRLRTPTTARVFDHGPVWIAATKPVDPEKAAIFEATNVTLLCLPADQNGRVDLQALLAELEQMGVTNLMVEGGASVITSFLSRRLVDYLVLTIAPVLVGGLPSIEAPLGEERGKGWTNFPRLESPASGWCGKDLIVWGVPVWNA